MTPPIRMVSVPVEPTEAMMLAADAVDWNNEDERAAIINMWQAMLTAAPVREEAGAVDVMADLLRRLLAAWPDDHVMGASLAVEIAAVLATREEVQPVAWRSRQREMYHSGKPGVWNYGESRTLPDDDPVYENQPLYAARPAPSETLKRVSKALSIGVNRLRGRSDSHVIKDRQFIQQVLDEVRTIEPTPPALEAETMRTAVEAMGHKRVSTTERYAKHETDSLRGVMSAVRKGRG